MGERILLTGGAGFIGRHLASALLAQGHRVRVLDKLIAQVHPDRARPAELDPEAELMVADIRDSSAVACALKGVDSIVHLAAEVGVGQSMYEVERYTSVNDLGTAVLFQQLIDRPVRRVVVASSMSVYGEGLYRTVGGALVEDAVRLGRQPDGGWDPVDETGRPLRPVPTPETKAPSLRSVYAINKYVQERLTLTLTAQYGMEGVALRLWNIYGPGQSLSNPYTGVLAIFAARIAAGEPPLLFEDGQQRRDFVAVGDVVDAFRLALFHPQAAGDVFNIGSGEDRTVEQVARLQAAAMGRPDLAPLISGKARAGDIRHNIPDIGKARRMLGYAPSRDFGTGLAELAQWAAAQTGARSGPRPLIDPRADLEVRGLVA